MGFTDFIKNIVFAIGIVYFSIMIVFAPVAVLVLISLSYYFYKKKNKNNIYYKFTKEELDRIIYIIDRIRKADDYEKK